MELSQIPFKIRCSKLSDFMTGEIGLTEKQKATLTDYESRKDITEKPLTEKQALELDALDAEINELGIGGLSAAKQKKYDLLAPRKGAKANPLTDRQREEMLDLRERAKNNDLPQTVKTLLINWLDEILHQQTCNFSNKYTQKGNAMESESLIVIAQYLGIPDFALCKNEKSFECEWIQGTPDALPLYPDIVVDAKSSFSIKTFPLHKKNVDPVYWHQMQGYMYLTGRKQALVCHTLVDTPEFIVINEARNLAKETGVEFTEEIFEEVAKNHRHSHKPLVLRAKGFWVGYDPSYIEEVKRRIPMAKNYIKNILEANPELHDIFLRNTGQAKHLF